MLPLTLQDNFRHYQQERRTGEGDQRHNRIHAADHYKSQNEPVHRNDDRRQPVDGIGADRTDVSVEPVEDITIAVPADGQPVRVNDLVKNIRLNVIIDINAQPRGDPADNAVKDQAEQGAADHDQDQCSQPVGLVVGDDANDLHTCQAADHTHRHTENTQDHIKSNGLLMPGTVRKNPFPVIDDLLKGAVFPALMQFCQSREKRAVLFLFIFFHESSFPTH